MYGADQQLATIRDVRRSIEAAGTIDDLKAPLLTLVGMLERDAESEVIDADLILGIRRPSDSHRP